jgi:hypothetical protein
MMTGIAGGLAVGFLLDSWLYDGRNVDGVFRMLRAMAAGFGFS